MSKEEKRNYAESLKNYNYLQNTLDTSERVGYEKGLKELTPLLEEAKAREKEAKAREKEAIKTMIELGIPIETLADKLKISAEEINKFI